MAVSSRRLLDIRPLVRHRRFGERMRRALYDLARIPCPSFRQVADRHRVDLGDLHRLAGTVPGLLEARREWQSGGGDPQRQAAA